MKQENVIFLILVLAAAVVLGTTFGIINGYLTLAVHQKSLPAIPSDDSTFNDYTDPSNENKQSAHPQKEECQIASSKALHNGNQDIFLTPLEIREIQGMLAQMGYSHSNWSQSIRLFQEQNNINATGILDNSTLDSIINQITLKKAHAVRS